ncbi:MAG: helix-turn-helix domain-containing protein [Verrucomicrobiota bacterium]|nr:helix-turn-helix domain-containing protein [Verrucomicrobiota bacterium]
MPTEFKTPGQLIQALLDERGWSKRVLAVVLGASETGINKIINGKQPLTADMALSLKDVFGIPAERFLELQKHLELEQAKLFAMEDSGLAVRAKLFGAIPVDEIIKRGWMPGVADIRDFQRVETGLMKFFKASSLDQIEVFPHSAKKTNVSEPATPIQIAWLYRVKEIASEMLVPRYSPSAVMAAIPKLRELLVSHAAIRKVPRILQDCGVRYVIVEKLPGAKIDGVCFWLDDQSPVIGMSIQYDRIDNFWFVLRHELEHVIQGHGKNAMMIDADLHGEGAGTGESIAEEEKVANAAASDFCTPKKSIESFIARKAPLFKERDLIGFANTLAIHPGVVVGQLQRKTGHYELFRSHLVKVRSIIATEAMIDGWGTVAPVGL